ncbi:Uncharacterised protein [Klebsiella pneumoniae]|nr:MULTISPECIES: hypothetical protein [Klebsiella]HBQ4452429.1 hypothetical protein [Klebsiella pneumoniae subsp. pneumoniae]HBT4716485.1 hypothetical protein [Klebsiella quasipneumoniae subsp. quasipneumoniae]HCI5998134.1 hypothetical protein [Klebsiella variicola subsp. variicola]EIY4985490.1 hypothetical protein [Klebsiella quasipneumoniae]EKU7931687.1 hypothetical protein [Klebsiella pneumoniae]
MSQEQVWEQTVHAVLGAAIELGYDVDKIAEKAKQIMLGNEVYRFVGHSENEVTRTIDAIESTIDEVKKIHESKPK